MKINHIGTHLFLTFCLVGFSLWVDRKFEYFGWFGDDCGSGSFFLVVCYVFDENPQCKWFMFEGVITPFLLRFLWIYSTNKAAQYEWDLNGLESSKYIQ